MNDSEYAEAIAKALENIKGLIAAQNANALEILQHSAKFVAVLDRHRRKLARQAKKPSETITKTDKPAK